MTTSCPRCGGSVADLGHDGARCVMCGHDGTSLRAPTAQDKIDARHTGGSSAPISPLDKMILDGALDHAEYLEAVRRGWWNATALKRRLRLEGRL